jgi:hypothetical protein
LQTERAKLVNLDRPTHPDVVAIDRQISAEQVLIESLRPLGKAQPDTAPSLARGAQEPATAEVPEDDGSVTQLKSQLEANRLDIENIMKNEAQQKALISQYQSRLNLTPVREQQLAGILRDYDLSKQDYTDLLGKEQQSQLATSLEKQQGGQQFRLVEPPSLPDLPSSPKRVKSSLMGVGAGLLLGLALAFITDLARPTFHTAREVSQRFGAPLVVGLPVVLIRSEKRRRGWKKTFEFVGGSVLALVIGVAEFYVLKHP